MPPITASLGAESLAIPPSPDTPAEVYSRVARGALKCWFGPDGSLKRTHVFHARVDPPSSGGTAEIGVSTRDPVSGSSSQGSLRAFRVGIAPNGGSGSLVEAQNVRFPEEQARLMSADITRWVAGQEGCSVVGTGGWTAGPGAEQPAEPAPKAKPSSRKAAAATKPKAASESRQP
ncbi:MAG: hypothetical protein AB7O57_04680 [Hyphomicrobiaceae bacterium]